MTTQQAIQELKYFINKYQAIPAELWCINKLYNELGQHCAIGHCYNDSIELKRLISLNQFLTNNYIFRSIRISVINNGNNPNYQQSTPKERVIAYLTDKLNELEPQSITTIDELLAEDHLQSVDAKTLQPIEMEI